MVVIYQAFSESLEGGRLEYRKLFETLWIQGRVFILTDLPIADVHIGQMICNKRHHFYSLKRQFEVLGESENIHFTGADVLAVHGSEVPDALSYGFLKRDQQIILT
jgi:hypothetical protein